MSLTISFVICIIYIYFMMMPTKRDKELSIQVESRRYILQWVADFVMEEHETEWFIYRKERGFREIRKQNIFNKVSIKRGYR